jgi:hypothetical protein
MDGAILKIMAQYGSLEWREKHRRGPLSRGLDAVMRESCAKVPRGLAGTHQQQTGFYYSWTWEPYRAGSFMEETVELLNAVNAEVAESKARLEALANEVRALSDVVNPALAEQANALRTARMSVISEVNQSLTAMRDVRKFFFESSYEEEIARLERFVRVCREIQELKKAGIFDAVCDAAIRLAIKEGTP